VIPSHGHHAMRLQQLAANIQVSAPIGQIARAQNGVNFRFAKKI
jgi:hypothetical protein